MINIILSCSQQAWNKCVMGDSEEDHTFEIAKRTGLILSDYDCNVLVISKDIKGTETETLNQVVKASNEFSGSGQNFHLDIHTDGGYAGKGSSGFYYSENGRKFINIIHSEVSKITPWLDGGTAQRDLYVLKATHAVAGLIELSFHDVYEQAKHMHENMDLYAQALASGLIRACGLQKKVGVNMQWKEILKKVSDSPEVWEKAINTAAAAAKTEGNIGDLEIFAFLPDLIEKIYNAK